MSTQGQQRSALRLLIGRKFFPLRSADAAEENGVALFACGDGFSRQRLALGVNGCASDELFVKFKFDTGLGFDFAKHLDGFSHDFRSDAVTGEHCDFVGF